MAFGAGDEALLHRFIHHIGGLPDFSALKFTRYNQYESLVLPLTMWLQGAGRAFRRHRGDRRRFRHNGRSQAGDRIDWKRSRPTRRDRPGPRRPVHDHRLADRELDDGDHHTPARLDTGPAPAWDLWRRIAAKDPSFGRPDVFGAHIPETKWDRRRSPRSTSAFPLTSRRSPSAIRSGKVVTGGIVTVRDSSWLLSWTVNRQPHFKAQPKDQIVVWFYGLFVDRPATS
jgi:oleate hydratase